MKENIMGVDGKNYYVKELSNGTVMFEPRPTQQYLANCYAKLTPLGNTPWHAWVLEDARKIVKTLSRLNINPPGRFIEVGPAHGYKMVALRELGWDVEGVDLEPAVYAQVYQRYNLNVRQGNIEELESLYGNSSIDVIGMYEVMEHVLHPDVVVSRVHEMLKPGGWFVGTTPNARSLHRILSPKTWLHRHGKPPLHLQLFSADGLMELLKSAGFSTVQFGSVPTLSGPSFSIDLRKKLPRISGPLTIAKAFLLGSIDRIIMTTGFPPEHLFWAAQR